MSRKSPQGLPVFLVFVEFRPEDFDEFGVERMPWGDSALEWGAKERFQDGPVVVGGEFFHHQVGVALALGLPSPHPMFPVEEVGLIDVALLACFFGVFHPIIHDF